MTSRYSSLTGTLHEIQLPKAEVRTRFKRETIDTTCSIANNVNRNAIETMTKRLLYIQPVIYIAIPTHFPYAKAGTSRRLTLANSSETCTDLRIHECQPEGCPYAGKVQVKLILLGPQPEMTYLNLHKHRCGCRCPWWSHVFANSDWYDSAIHCQIYS